MFYIMSKGLKNKSRTNKKLLLPLTIVSIFQESLYNENGIFPDFIFTKTLCFK